MAQPLARDGSRLEDQTVGNLFLTLRAAQGRLGAFAGVLPTLRDERSRRVSGLREDAAEPRAGISGPAEFPEKSAPAASRTQQESTPARGRGASNDSTLEPGNRSAQLPDSASAAKRRDMAMSRASTQPSRFRSATASSPSPRRRSSLTEIRASGAGGAYPEEQLSPLSA